MKIRRHLLTLRKEAGPIVLAAGFFDGLHKGHCRVIRRALRDARRLGGKVWVLTFEPHPMKVLNPIVAPRLITSNRHKLKLIERMEVDGCLLMPFTSRVARMKAELFVRRLRACIPPVCEICVGANWQFGYQGKGNAAMLKRLGKALCLRVVALEPVKYRGLPVSSTRIRREIAHGNLAETARLLGRPYSILGTVVRGRGVGRGLGFPTANLNPHNEVLPPNGVYAVRVLLHSRRRRVLMNGVLNLGIRPTFSRKPNPALSIELHIPGFKGSIYGQDIEAFFVRRIRDEIAFASRAELRSQIARDVCISGKILGKSPEESFKRIALHGTTCRI